MELQQIIIIAMFLCVLGIGALWLLRVLLYALADRYGWQIGTADYDEYDDESDDAPVVVPPIATTTTTPATSNNRIATPQNTSNELLLRAKAETLAAMIHAGKVTQTEGIKLVFGIGPSSTNPRYQAARDATVAAVQRLKAAETTTYPELTPEQAQARQWLTEE
jgi:hypothetical protein